MDMTGEDKRDLVVGNEYARSLQCKKRIGGWRAFEQSHGYHSHQGYFVTQSVADRSGSNVYALLLAIGKRFLVRTALGGLALRADTTRIVRFCVLIACLPVLPDLEEGACCKKFCEMLPGGKPLPPNWLQHSDEHCIQVAD